MCDKYLYKYEKTIEGCPACTSEIELPFDKLINCPECGHKDVLPCSMCKPLEQGKCDWQDDAGNRDYSGTCIVKREVFKK